MKNKDNLNKEKDSVFNKNNCHSSSILKIINLINDTLIKMKQSSRQLIKNVSSSRHSIFVFVLVFLSLLRVASAQCLDGYFDDDGICQMCHESCATCENEFSWTAWVNRIFNITSGLWEICEEGKYYSESDEQWILWSTNCADLCAYNVGCFECNSGEFYDLDSRTCIEECSSEKLKINNPMLRSLNICRSLNYYVDNQSIKVLELGTKDFPYKDISHVFVEILNLHSHSERSINVHIKENTVNYISQESLFIINMTLVNIESYSDTEEEASHASLFGVNYDVNTRSYSTITNILVNTTLNLAEIINTPKITTAERNALSLKDSNIYCVRSSLRLNKIDLHRDVAKDSQILTNFIRAMHIQEKNITVSNAFIRINGFIMYTNDPLSLFVENIYVDSYAAMGGFIMFISCNYPEAYTTGQVRVINGTTLNSRERTAPFSNPLARNTGPENFKVTGSYVSSWGSLKADAAQIEKLLSPLWNPDDDVVQTVEVSTTYWTLTNNPTKDRYVIFYNDYNQGHLRKVVLRYEDNVHENVTDNAYQVFLAYVTPLTDVYMKNNIFTNFSGSQGWISVLYSNSISAENEVFQDSTNFGIFAYSYFYTNAATIRNMTIRNSNATASSNDYFVYLSINNEATVSLDYFNFRDCKVGKQKGFAINGIISKLSISNSYFSDLTIGTGNTLLSTGEFRTISISNVTFFNIHDETTEDENNFMISVDEINLNNALDSLIQDVTVESSSIGFLKFGLISGTPSEQIEFLLSGITYKNWEFSQPKDLIYFRNLETRQNIIFAFDDLEFRNIFFTSQGNLLKFNQQILNQLVIKNSVFEDIRAGVIYIESANKQTLEYETKIKLENVTFNDIDPNTGSLLIINEGGNLEIRDSTFTNIHCVGEGAVLYAGYQKAKTVIYNSKFMNNTSVQGSIFNIESESVVKVYDSEITNNFAIISGVIQANNNGYFEFYNWSIYENYALSSSVSQVFDVANTPVINGWTIHDNLILSVTQLENELNSVWTYLCFMNEGFKEHLRDNPGLYTITTSKRVFQLISSNLLITNQTVIYNEGALVDSFVSTLTIENSLFYDLETTSSAFTITSSTMIFQNTELHSISATDNLALLTVTLESSLMIDNIKFTNSELAFIACLNSESSITNLEISNVTSNPFVFRFEGSQNLSLTNWDVKNIHSNTEDSSISIQSSYVFLFKNITLTDLYQIPLKLETNTVDLIDNLKVSNSTKRVYIKLSKVTLFSNSVLENWGGNSVKHGGGLLLENSNVTAFNLTFLNTTAIDGGGLFYSCLGASLWTLNLSNLNFINTKAVSSGGAIKYDVYRPILANNIFINNTAEYGPTIASYAVKIKIKDSTDDLMNFSNVGSGIQSDVIFTLALYDYDEQIMNLDSSSQILIKTLDSEGELAGTTSVTIKNGEAFLNDVTFIANPGTTNVNYKVSSTGINNEVVVKQFGSTFTQNDIIVSFRFCKPGEIEENNKWRAWSAGTYSFLWNSTKCEFWMSDAEWLGKDEIKVKNGFWRNTGNSTKVVECPNPKACKGGYNRTNEHPVNWEKGYGGDLWSEWIFYEGRKYESLGDFECSKCPDPTLNAIRVVGVGIAVLLFISALIIMNIRKKKESQPSILMRIMTNYLQIMTATMSYSMKFPDTLNALFLPVEKLGSSGETIMSYDWFVEDSQITLFAPSTQVLKIFMVAILPIILLAGCAVFWITLRLIFKKRMADYKRNIVVSMITIMFLLHPTLTETALGMFQWIEIDENTSKVRIDLNMDWYSTEHIAWCMFIGVPMIGLWVIGTPLLALIILIKCRKDLDNPSIQKYLIVLYQGLKNDKFYWELVNTVRKVLVSCINVFLARFNPFYKGMVAIILILIVYRVQRRLQPYKNREYNNLEIASFSASWITLYGGLLYSNEGAGSNPTVEFASFLLIVFLNIYFLIFWLYLMTLTSEKHKFWVRISIILRILLCKCKKAESNLVF